ncbi:MAG TPA: hypothetical protein VF452_14760 [Candidatus Binatia bacterium]
MAFGRTIPVFVVLWIMFFGSATWALAPSHEIAVRDFFPLVDWQKDFKITDGRDQGKVVPLSLHHAGGTQESWRLDFGDYAKIHLRNDVSGLTMDRLDLVKSRSFIVYEPALPVFARDLRSGVGITRQANFKMYDAETGRLKRVGRVTHVMKRVSRSRFQTPAGPIDGYYVEVDHRMDMQYAQLQMSVGLGCRLDDGPVYGSGRYTVTKLGLFTETKTVAAGLLSR